MPLRKLLMGQRANLVLVRDGQWSLFYSHWRANTLDRDLFWGPRYATAFVLSQEPCEPHVWLDDVWAEGGAVVDHDKRVLLFFGGEDVRYELPRRRLHLELMRRIWLGWEVRWAHEGIVDIAEYVGVPRGKVLSAKRDQPSLSLDPPEQRDWVDFVGAIRLRDGVLRLYPLAGDADEYLETGPSLLTAALERPGHDQVDLAEWGDSFPTGGFFVDETERAVELWTARDAPDCAARIGRRWPGWSVRWHRDRFEPLLARIGDVLRLPPVDVAARASQLRDALLMPSGTSGPELMTEVLDLLRNEGDEVTQVNPHALRDAQLDLPLDEKRAILNAALIGATGNWQGRSPGP